MSAFSRQNGSGFRVAHPWRRWSQIDCGTRLRRSQMIHSPPHNSDVLLLCLRFCASKYLDVTFMINMENGVNLLKLMLCNSAWNWMFKARSMKKIRQREMLSDQLVTCGDWHVVEQLVTTIQECRTSWRRFENLMPREWGLGAESATHRRAISVTWLEKAFQISSRSFHISSGMHWELPEKKNWITQMMRNTRPFSKKQQNKKAKPKQQSNQLHQRNHWNPGILGTFVVFAPGARGASGIRGWWWDRGFQVASETMEADGKCWLTAVFRRSTESTAVLFCCLLSMNCLHPEGEGWVQRMNQRTAI